MTEPLKRMDQTQRFRRGHDFLPRDAELAAIPPLYGTEHVKSRDKVIHLHYFVGGASNWWFAELGTQDEDAWIGFGYVVLGGYPEGAEWGYTSLVKLENLVVRMPYAVPVERDILWTPKLASECLPPEACRF